MRVLITAVTVSALAWPAAAQVEQLRSGRVQTDVVMPSDTVREATAITYPYDRDIEVMFRGTQRLPDASGQASVERERGTTRIEMELDEMKPASLFGGDFNTYVLWAVTPEGQVDNLGEFVLRGNRSKLDVSTNLGTFALFVTAEPHHLVNLPSRFVVLEMTDTDPDLSGESTFIRVHYEGYSGVYNYERESLADQPEARGLVRTDVKQAWTAVQLAERAGASEFAPDQLAAARAALEETLALAERDRARERVDAQARETVRLAVAAQRAAEDAAFEAALDAERRERQQELSRLEEEMREAETAAERARLEAERRRLEAQTEAEARREATERAEEARQRAEQAQRSAQESEQRAQEALMQAEQARRERETAQQQMREALSQIVETRETARGLILNIPDVLFDFDSADLKPEGRERLSRIAGIVLATPGRWDFSIEGHTDNVGSDEYNQRLSEQRAENVERYLVGAGVPAGSVTSQGFGESRPIASNESGGGRQRNRRVEIIIRDLDRPVTTR